MTRRLAWVPVCLLLLAAARAQQEPAVPPPAAPPAQATENPFRPFDRAAFEAAARALGATDAQIAAFGTDVAESGLARAADRLVRAAVPAFEAAAALAENREPAAALELTKVLAATQDPLLQAHVRYHLARLLLDNDDPEAAVEVLGAYLKDNVNRSPLDGEVAFFYSQALAELPRHDLALPRFKLFLQWFPEASERFRAAAHQRILEIEQQQESRLHTLADGMKKTRRDLKKQRTDKPVQKDQKRYIEELDELIEMFEEMERQSSGAPSGNGPSNNPASHSALPDGEATVGNLQKRPSLVDRWGDMKDRDREKIEAEVQQALPPQYRKMLEQYYKKLGQGQGTNPR